MKYLEYPLFAEGYVNRFLTAGVFTEVQQFDKVKLHGRVNECYNLGGWGVCHGLYPIYKEHGEEDDGRFAA